MSIVIPVRLTELELADLDRVRGEVKRSTKIKQLVRDCVAAHDGLVAHVDATVTGLRVARVPRVEPAPVVDAGTSPPMSRIDRAMAERERWRIAQKGGPNRA